ncbi:hypothetical protein B0T25DRAFT_528285, partial [Lasiosphaeria hispida]
QRGIVLAGLGNPCRCGSGSRGHASRGGTRVVGGELFGAGPPVGLFGVARAAAGQFDLVDGEGDDGGDLLVAHFCVLVQRANLDALVARDGAGAWSSLEALTTAPRIFGNGVAEGPGTCAQHSGNSLLVSFWWGGFCPPWDHGLFVLSHGMPKTESKSAYLA